MLDTAVLNPSSSATTVRKGAHGEAVAAAFLEEHGYQIITRNFRCPYGEIDLIALDQKVLCFVEVRTRISAEHGDPLETITQHKIHRIVCAARAFLAEMEGPWPMEMRFDAIGVTWCESAPATPMIQWVRGAFEAPATR